MKLIKIKHKDTGEVIYSHKCNNNTIKITVERAVKECINLNYAELSDCDLKGADLSYAKLHSANFYSTDLSYANLSHACLSHANLGFVTLSNVNLKNANLHYARLSNIHNYYSFVAYDTSKRIVHCIKHDKTWMILAGCFWGTLEELEDKVKATHNSKVYLANIEILKQL